MDIGPEELTFAITPGIEAVLDKEKKGWFYDRPRSDMTRELTKAGLGDAKEENRTADGSHEINT